MCRFCLLLVVLITRPEHFLACRTPSVRAEEHAFAPGDAVRAAADCLERNCVIRAPLNDQMSARWFRAFLDGLDPKRMYFLQADEAEFQQFEKRLDELAKAGEFAFPQRVRQRYETRVAEAIAFADQCLSLRHDYSVDEDFPIRFCTYAADARELRERWRMRIKFELLVEKAHGVAIKDAEAQLRSRYQRIARQGREMTDERLCGVFLTSLAACFDPHSAYLCPSDLEWFEIRFFRPYTLGLSYRNIHGQWIITSVQPSLYGSRIAKRLIGWQLLAIQRIGGPVYDVVELPADEFGALISSSGPLGKDTEVILELIDPVTLSRQTMNWVRFPSG